ncbi:nuclear transport factor 2 family protein [Parvularcula sp. LCG005]|uniref:nuclear transport factor 2 family protein n=1 Tax=Parvularcula sp. LCG005 TaxID=3078805 RepID=UPI0029430C9E|nr:nuclear transport factor 2 family protein [Parvularcula sp. LCG005]WOI54212.1 nuclear transport factor 2 family protein [Parvularcula sp. LCG005]
MKIQVIAMMCLALVGTAKAQDVGSLAEQITDMENRWGAALLANDLDAVDALMHTNFRLVRVYGEQPPISKEMYLGMQGMSATSIEITSVAITEVAGPVVVARTSWSLDWQQEGVGKLPPYFDLIDTWIQTEDGRWQILSRISQLATDR